MSGTRKSVYSERCRAEEYWDRANRVCKRCRDFYSITAGHEFTSNCGKSDDGGIQEGWHKDCDDGTFNTGSFDWCQVCSACPPLRLLSPCTKTSDTRCCKEGTHAVVQECRDGAMPVSSKSPILTTDHPTTTTFTSTAYKAYIETTPPTEIVHSTSSSKTTQALSTKTTTIQEPPSHSSGHHNPWIPLGAVFITILLCGGLFFLFYILKKKNHRACREMKRRLSVRSLGNHIPLDDSSEHIKPDITKELLDINDILSPKIQAAPLQTVMNDLDVVEELVLLLDPDTPGAKNTRHLAASCSIPFTWINYAYSMKDSRSPLIAVLERVIAKNPQWSVGHLAGLLNRIGRNDAVAVLGKLTVTTEEV